MAIILGIKIKDKLEGGMYLKMGLTNPVVIYHAIATELGEEKKCQKTQVIAL